jgi:Galactose oxidase, central domain
VSTGPQVFARSGLCAVALPDGRVMTLGGTRSSPNGLLSDAHVEMLVPGKNGAAPGLLGLMPLEQPRHSHTCSVLEDGSVLIAGGISDSGNGWMTLGDLVIYTPVPLD